MKNNKIHKTFLNIKLKKILMNIIKIFYNFYNLIIIYLNYSNLLIINI